MKKQTLSLLLFFVVSLLQAQNPLVKQWDKRYGGTKMDWFESFKQTSDEGYILGGWSESNSTGDKTENNWSALRDYWIVKLDSIGNKQWDKRFGGTQSEKLYDLQQTLDGGYILCGHSTSENDGDRTQPSWGNYDFWILKTDSIGNKIWDKRFGGTGDEYFSAIQQTTDGGYILGGFSDSDNSGDKTQLSWGTADYWIVKIDSIGNKQWDKRFGGTDYDALGSVQQTTDGGYILGGWSLSEVSGDKTQPSWGGADYWIVKTDSLGNLLWEKRFGGEGTDELFSVKQTIDGGYILGGACYSGISGDITQPSWGGYDLWIVKIDSLGIKQWDKRFGGTDYEHLGNVIQTYEGGYLISGVSNSGISGNKTEDNLGSEQGWMVKINSNGIKQWDKTIFAKPGEVETNCLGIQTTDLCYVVAKTSLDSIAGYKTQNNWDLTCNTSDYWIIKFCDTTLTTSVNQITDSQAPFSIYPNPTNTVLNLFVKNKENITITNLMGEIVLQQNAEGKIELDVSFLSPGIYFIKAGSEVRKFVKE